MDLRKLRAPRSRETVAAAARRHQKPGDLAKNDDDKNSTVIINLSGIRIFLKPVVFLHRLFLEDGLGLLALPPARFQPPSSLGSPVIPSRLPPARFKAHFAPGPPGRGRFFIYAPA